LLVARLVSGNVGERLVRDAPPPDVLVDVAERLDLDVGQLGEAALDRVALSADADARHHDAIVGADDPRIDVRRRTHFGRSQQVRPCRKTRDRTERCRELPPRDVATVVVACHHTPPAGARTPAWRRPEHTRKPAKKVEYNSLRPRALTRGRAHCWSAARYCRR